MTRNYTTMSLKNFNALCLCIFIIICFNSCKYDKHEKSEPDYNGYPQEIGRIMLNDCATQGCHTSNSATTSAGLDLSSWNALFKGSDNNSSVIPFSFEHSCLLYYVNTFPDLGPAMCPSMGAPMCPSMIMPLNKTALKKEEVEKIKNWITSGAPDANGNIKWSENPNRRKAYVANQGCDFITVFDADSKMVMRTIDVGNSSQTEAPHDMAISPDGEFIYLSFYANSIFQKYRTSTGNKEGELNLNTLSWHAIALSGNGKYALCTHFDADGKIALIDLTTFSINYIYQGSGLFIYPHGNTFNYDGTLAYVTAFMGNFLYKVDLTDPSDLVIEQISLQPGETPVTTDGLYKPYEVTFSPDYSKYYVTCQGTNQVRVFLSQNDSLIKIISTSGIPQLISFSQSRPYAFVSCISDSANSATQSSINIINTVNDVLISTIDSGYQPRGLAVDDANDCVWIANRNVSGLGVVPHHTTACAGADGYVTIINMNTLQLVPGWKTGVSVDPYCVVIRK
jgi:DNA-binding beta-propeller fold protein YncE